MMTCHICGNEFDEYEMVNGICIACASIMSDESIMDVIF